MSSLKKSKSLTAFALLLASVSIAGLTTAALADGMPYKKVKAAPLPIDQAIDQVENTQPPVAVAPPPPVEQPAPQVVQTEPPPVPEARVVEVQNENSGFFGLSVGMYNPQRDMVPALNFEYQTGTKIAGVLQPLFGGMVTTEGTLLGYGGLGLPFHLGDHIFVMPSLAVGAYKPGGGYDLKQTLAVRAGTELSYEFDDKSRIGINAHLIGNGNSLQKKDTTGIVALTYTMPMSVFSGPWTKQ